MALIRPTDAVLRARSKWRWHGQERPAFADAPAPGQRSVWDFPRPPRLEPAGAPVRVAMADGTPIAETARAVAVLETAGAPTYYVPPDDVAGEALTRTGDTFHCEWKGLSDEVSAGTGGARVQRAGWVLTEVYEEFEALAGWYAFYPQELACFVGGERATSQPGGYYGGWVTADLAGPIKGAPGSGGW